MRWLSCLLTALLLVAVSTAALALTQEEILQRRLEKMRQAEPTMRAEEQDREERSRQNAAAVTRQPSKVATDSLPIPEPVRRPSPEPGKSLWRHTGTSKTASPAPTAQEAAQTRPAASTPTPPAAKPAVPAAPAPAVPTPAAPPATVATAPAQQKTGDPKQVAALAAKASALAKSGKVKEALALLDEALATSPNDPDLRVNRGNIFNNMGKPKEALAEYDRAIAARSSDPVFFTNRGLAYERLGNPKQACADYKKACDLGDCDFFKSYKAEGHCR